MNSREKSRFDILGKIEQERQKRGWSEYMLARNSDIPQSTISTWYRKQLQPSIASIEHICDGFGITLAQFFEEDETSNVLKEQLELLDLWQKLSPEQRHNLILLLQSFHKDK